MEYNVVSDIQHLVSDIQHLASDIQHVVSDIRHMVSDIQQVLSYIQHMVSDIRHMVSDIQQVLSDIQHMVNDIRHVVSDIQHVLSDIQHVVSDRMRTLHSSYLFCSPDILPLLSLPHSPSPYPLPFSLLLYPDISSSLQNSVHIGFLTLSYLILAEHRFGVQVQLRSGIMANKNIP